MKQVLDIFAMICFVGAFLYFAASWHYAESSKPEKPRQAQAEMVAAEVIAKPLPQPKLTVQSDPETYEIRTQEDAFLRVQRRIEALEKQLKKQDELLVARQALKGRGVNE